MRKPFLNVLQRWLATVFLRPAPLLTAALVILLGAQPGRASAAELLPVVASFSILGDLTQRVGGEHVQVYTLVGPLADAHVYQPTPADVKKLARARLVVVNGLGFEGWIDRLIMSSGYRGLIVVASKGVNVLQKEAAHTGKHRSHDHPADVDPHAWQDLAQARYYVDNIAAALAQVDPANKVSYQANAAALRREIDVLDSEIRSSLSKLPVERRVVVSSHDAFGYFARAYGIRFLAPVGLSTDAQPSAAAVGGIIRQIRREKIPAMFIENVSDARLLERISAESGARIGGVLYSDSLAAPGTAADSYLGMMRANAKTLATALAD
ncbi:MAG: Pneumococcal surface adhesin A [Candidatus Accumulibacter appositus]|uniref:Pneumococcal surface adhesin A n=1 Tax=Candidatus Accumulibacter appositus TaxID=1454003 RepID=A0A011PMT0_9PROT|nr:metal ABC transporter substrate-binding protein [Accumulibacter sp.]EXI78165.1 MAG: Pneumococcal surface adhesin A [Candidatus Accumulibacter appositus]HRF04708.1 metal ABC transporter substrate-binding protein [Accumulibacter sp.]